MRLGYFSMPLHPLGRTWRETLAEDREAVVLADQLGFHDAFIGEHLTDRHENITNSLVFLATLIGDTQTIRLGTGTTNLSQQHPVLVAANSAMFDHLSDGRFILGVSPGALASDAEALGLLDENRNEIFAEAVDVITAIWAGEAPYNIRSPGGRFTVSTGRTMDEGLGVGFLPKPLQQPRPEIVGTVVAPYSQGVVAMGTKDFHPLSANFLLPQWVATHWPKYVEGKESVGAVADLADWRVARTIFVADTHEQAVEYAKDAAHSPYRFYYEQMLTKMRKLGRLNLFKADQSADDDTVGIESLLDHLVIVGTAEEVAEQLVDFHGEVGGFGELVYAGLDWVDAGLARRSMELMAQEVIPSVERAIGDRTVAGGRVVTAAGALEPPGPDQLTPEQQAAVAAIVAGPRGALVGPFAPLLHSPELMTRVQKVGEHLRFGTALSDRLLETAILCVARRWDQSFEWGFHQPLALAAGVPQDVVDAIGAGRRPDGEADLVAVHDLASALLDGGQRDEAAWAHLAAELAPVALVELVATLGYYTTLALVMNAAGTEPTADMPALPQRERS